jgi:hypothetical protein
MAGYPQWRHYPLWRSPGNWVPDVLDVVAAGQESISSAVIHLKSNQVLAHLKDGLVSVGFQVESSGVKLPRPVLYGDEGSVVKAFNVDAFRATDGIAIEVASGGAVYNNRVLLDLIKMSLAVDVNYGAILVPVAYATEEKTWQAPYPEAVKLFDAMNANPERFRLPLEGLILVGY